MQQVAPKVTRVGWIGTGIMGRSMCEHILNAGYDVTTYNRTLSKCDYLEKLGAKIAQTPVEVARQSDVVFTIVGYPKDVRSVILEKNGVLEGLKKDGILVDMTTSDPTLAAEIHEAASSKGIQSIDAPVSGGDVGAKNGTLSIMLGGETESIQTIMPLLSLLGKNIIHMGGAGAGQHTKMVNQILIATNMIGVVEGLMYASKSGLDAERVIEAVGAGAAGSWSINNLGPRISKRDFNPGFMVEHFLKDMGIALEESRRMGISLPGLALARELYVAVQAQGHGQMGTQALLLALETLNGIKGKELLSDKETIDKWLKVNGYNEFGDPIGTMYMGGTPLFDELSGEVTDRHVYLRQKFPNEPWLPQNTK